MECKITHQTWGNVQASQPHCNQHSGVEGRETCCCNEANETISVAKAALVQVHDSHSMTLPLQHHDNDCYSKQLGKREMCGVQKTSISQPCIFSLALLYTPINLRQTGEIIILLTVRCAHTYTGLQEARSPQAILN